GQCPGVPMGALDGPGDHVLQAAEDGPALAGRLVGAKAITRLDPGSAPSALLGHLSSLAGRMAGLRIVVLEGDQTGQELLQQALRVIDPDVIALDVELEPFDLSLENRRRTENEVCTEGAGDVGSPNRLIREAIDGKVIVRTGRRIPGVSPLSGIHYPISVVRMAVE